MYQQQIGQSQSQTHSHLLAEEDLAYTVLADLKRVSKEYATAVTESNSPTIRQTFTSLLNNTLRLQGELYTAMSQNNLYDAPTSALRQEVDKQLQKQKQSQQKANQVLQKAGLQTSSSINNIQQQQSEQLQYQNFAQNQFQNTASAFQSGHNQQQSQQALYQSSNQFQPQSTFKPNALYQQQAAGNQQQHQQHQQQQAIHNQQRQAQNNGFLPLQPIHQSPANPSSFYS